MSHSKRRARGQSYYLDAVNKPANKYIRACSACGKQGFDPVVIENERNRLLVRELQHLYSPLPLNPLGLCSHCAELLTRNERSTGSPA